MTINETHQTNLGVEIAKQSDFYLLYEGEQLTGYAISLMPNDNAN